MSIPAAPDAGGAPAPSADEGAPAPDDLHAGGDQENFLFHLYRGSELLEQDRLAEARGEIELALTIRPTDPKAHDLLGAVRARMGLPASALDAGAALATGRNPDPAVPLLLAPPDATVSLHPTGAVLVRVEPDRAFAARLDAIRAVVGAASTRVLHRRSAEGDTPEVLGGVASPLVRVEGAARLVLGARGSRTAFVLPLEGGRAVVREDALLGFELRLAHESARLWFEPEGAPASARSGRPSDAPPAVQVRGVGAVALEIAGRLAGIPSAPGRPTIVRREWVVGWTGRLEARALTAAESPNGQRAMLGFSGDGTVLVSAGSGP